MFYFLPVCSLFTVDNTWFLYFSVIGALIGKQKGRSLEIMNSFELVFNVIEERDIVIDRDYYNTKEEQCMKQENN